MACVFCQIGEGTAAAALVCRTPLAVVFLDKSPLFLGHCLVVPRAHHETLADLPEAELPAYFALVQAVAKALPVALGAEGTFVGINNRVSQSVPHLHTHVVPRRRKDGLRGFFWPRARYTGGPDEMEAWAARIRAALEVERHGPGSE